ncbi:MAG: DUF393 domain-containing protein [Actinobacteria bacterium]|nr:DUF393 domain-containing protein [Actinomycetota bacterium]
MTGHRSETPLHVVFDGQCGVCTRAARWLAARDRRDRIRVHPAQRPGVLRQFGLSEEAASQAAWAIEERDGGTASYRGAAAINRALDVALGTRLFLPLYRVPGIQWVQDRAYRWVAENRFRLRGVIPWCQTHPEDCPGVTGPASCAL